VLSYYVFEVIDYFCHYSKIAYIEVVVLRYMKKPKIFNQPLLGFEVFL